MSSITYPNQTYRLQVTLNRILKLAGTGLFHVKSKLHASIHNWTGLEQIKSCGIPPRYPACRLHGQHVICLCEWAISRSTKSDFAMTWHEAVQCFLRSRSWVKAQPLVSRVAQNHPKSPPITTQCISQSKRLLIINQLNITSFFFFAKKRKHSFQNLITWPIQDQNHLIQFNIVKFFLQFIL